MFGYLFYLRITLKITQERDFFSICSRHLIACFCCDFLKHKDAWMGMGRGFYIPFRKDLDSGGPKFKIPALPLISFVALATEKCPSFVT